MTNYETNRKNMDDAVIGVHNEYQTTLDKYPALNEEVIGFKSTVAEIEVVDDEYMNSTSGKTKEKNNALDVTLVRLLPVKGGLYSYAVKKKNEELIALTDITESQLKQLSDVSFLKRSEDILKAAQANLADLAPYAITQEKLALLKENIDLLKIMRTKKSTGFNNKSALRKQLTALFKKADDSLNKHQDNLMEAVREDDINYYNAYKAARVIKDQGGSRGGSSGTTGSTPPNQPNK
jgi:hypothetical protein